MTTKQILLAEDNPADVFLVREALATHKLQVDLHVVSNGEAVVRFIEAIDLDDSLSCPDLVLLDLNLPRASGHEILEHLRQSRRCGQIPVVILSSSASLKDQAAANRLQITGFFRKPSDYDEFMRLGELVHGALQQTGNP